MTSTDVKELKSVLLKLLEEDEEFRYVVAAKIGLLEILEELKRLREDFNKLYQKSLEHDKRFEAIERKLLEHDKRFEVIEKKLFEYDKRFEAVEKKLLEHDKRFETIEQKLLEHDKRFEEMNRRISRIELELGALSESFYCRSLWEDLREELASRGEKIIRRERNAVVEGREIDLLIETDRAVYVVEIKVKPNHEDVDELLAKAEAVAKRYPQKKVVPILAGALIGKEIVSYAEGKGVKIYLY